MQSDRWRGRRIVCWRFFRFLSRFVPLFSSYSDWNNTRLSCRLESREVGKCSPNSPFDRFHIHHHQWHRIFSFYFSSVFNVTLLVSDDYGRSLADSSLYRMSGTGQLYNFETNAGLFSLLFLFRRRDWR